MYKTVKIAFIRFVRCFPTALQFRFFAFAFSLVFLVAFVVGLLLQLFQLRHHGLVGCGHFLKSAGGGANCSESLGLTGHLRRSGQNGRKVFHHILGDRRIRMGPVVDVFVII